MKPARHAMVPLLLAALFFAPWLLAWALYHHADLVPRSGLQQGELLLPLQPLALPPLTEADGAVFDTAIFRGRWTLLYRRNDRCDSECRQVLTTLQNVRLAQGEAMSRVQRVLVLATPLKADEAQELSASDLRVVTATHWPLPHDWIYLLDPQGNMVLRYRPGFEPRGLLNDLQRLLRQSGAG